MGLRAQESQGRQKLPVFVRVRQFRGSATGTSGCQASAVLSRRLTPCFWPP